MAKSKPKKRLTLCTDGRWRKMYKGKLYYFRGAYGDCLKAWELQKVKLDNGGLLSPAVQQAIAERQELKSRLAGIKHGVIGLGDKVYPTGEGLTIVLDEDIAALNRGEVPSAFGLQTALFNDFVEHHTRKFQSNSATVGGAVDAFLKSMMAKYKAGKIVAGRYDNVRRDVERFRDHVGPTFPITDLNGATLVDWHNHCLGLKKSDAYAKKIMGNVKQLIQFSYETNLLPALPRNLHSSNLAIKVTAKTIPILTVKEFQKHFDGTPDKTKLYLLLQLNCGYTQVDIATLHQDHVNWKDGTVTRKRKKTDDNANVPVVTYKLWPKTFDLLKRFRSFDSVLVFLNEDGKPLMTQTVDEKTGRLKKSDNFRQLFVRLCKRLKIDSKRSKDIRKTGASALGENPSYATLAELYLGHAPRTIAGKHYVKPSQELFDAAIEWLGDKFEVSEL